jgi:cyclopropane fatty-acyl-phospholipid synthase-like methyltransferase
VKAFLPYGIVVLIQKRKKHFPGSAAYWEKRYEQGGNSGAGSYNNLAEFKADVINNFVQANGIKTVIEFGCGDGNQLSLSKYPEYIGFDVSATAIDMCKKRFENDHTKKFYIINDYKGQMAELVLSLDVVYHLVEDIVYFAYMEKLFKASTQYIIIYAPDREEKIASHVRLRKFTGYIENRGDCIWNLIDYIPNKYPYDKKCPQETSWSDFYIYKNQS